MTDKTSISKTATKRSFESEPVDIKDRHNFWERGGYKFALNRVENSFKIFSELQTMFDELANHYVKYGKCLIEWSDKWTKYISIMDDSHEKKFFSCGTTKDALISCIKEMNDEGKSNIENWNKIQSMCIMPLKLYNDCLLNKNFASWKEGKEIKEDFFTAQEPYLEALQYYKKAKLKYISLCQSLDSSFDIEYEREFIESLDDTKKKEKIEIARKRYLERKDQLEIIIPRYKEKMISTYERCNVIEKRKLHAIKTSLEGLKYVTDTTNNKMHCDVLKTMTDKIEAITIEDDIDLWDINHGAKMEYDFFSTDDKTRPKSSIMMVFSKTNSKDIPDI